MNLTNRPPIDAGLPMKLIHVLLSVGWMVLLAALPQRPAVAAQPTTQPAAYINQALDKPIQLHLDAQLPDALARITQQTGVPIEADPQVWTLLPWGRLTHLNVTLENQTLRQALDALTSHLGLIYHLQADGIEIRPSPALHRLGRRATPQELSLLVYLSDTRLTNSSTVAAQTLLGQIDQQLAQAKTAYAVENRMGDPAGNNPPLQIVRNASLLEALNELPRQTDFTWYPWDQRIVVLRKADLIRMQLSQPITIRLNDVDILQVLSELASRADVPFNIEPGAIQRIAPEYRNIRLILENAPIHQALTSISGYTGLGFVVKDDGVYFWNQSPPANTRAARFLGMLQLPGMDLAIPVRDTDVSPALRQYLEKQAVQAIAQLEKAHGETPSAATTRPSSEP